ncbi:TD and POZ domain-containing protein 1-like [Araneus ventricosus]|uniref:TD and POZ domain-containing protein 1-like n=1 Tax=Araneus ventricosus TaxID=182803 RepID=A0A4Y2PV21_ARAVE|nr:TD and POZ domain-containing protein 1-like [Araneus ventricosus]
MDKYCEYKILCNSGKSEYYFFTWAIPNASSIYNLKVSTGNTTMLNGYTYNAILCGSKDKISFSIGSSLTNLKCFVSMFIGSETLLLSNSLNAHTSVGIHYNYDLLTLSCEDEGFQKFKQYPNETLVFICKIIKPGHSFSTVSVKTPVDIPTDSLYNLKTLAAAFKNSSKPLSKEKILLRVGEEAEIVGKAVLCARSSVFAKMFENDMRELKEKTVTITDIKMPVLKVLVSFLYTGKLWNSDSDLASNGGFDFLCDLYYASDKYNIIDLRQLCVDLLLPQISMENIILAMKLAFSHNDVQLKSSVLALIATNIETWVFTNDWKNLVNDEPDIAAEVLIFFDF